MVKIGGSLQKEKKDETVVEKRERQPSKPKMEQQVGYAEMVSQLNEIKTMLAEQSVNEYQNWQFRIQCFSALKAKLRRGHRPEQDALVEMLESLL